MSVPHFGTKFTYFVTKASAQTPAPVLDAVVQRWFRRYVPEARLKLDWSSADSYETYLAHLSQWSKELSHGFDTISEDEVEYLIYLSGAAVEGAVQPDDSLSPTMAKTTTAELLERLEVALGPTALAEAAPHLEALYRIILEADER